MKTALKMNSFGFPIDGFSHLTTTAVVISFFSVLQKRAAPPLEYYNIQQN